MPSNLRDAERLAHLLNAASWCPPGHSTVWRPSRRRSIEFIVTPCVVSLTSRRVLATPPRTLAGLTSVSAAGLLNLCDAELPSRLGCCQLPSLQQCWGLLISRLLPNFEQGEISDQVINPDSCVQMTQWLWYTLPKG